MIDGHFDEWAISCLTCPGFPFSHRKASYSVANSGALSLMSITLMATIARDIWLWFPDRQMNRYKGIQEEALQLINLNKTAHATTGKSCDLVLISFYSRSSASFPELMEGHLIRHINLHFSRYQWCKTGSKAVDMGVKKNIQSAFEIPCTLSWLKHEYKNMHINEALVAEV